MVHSCVLCPEPYLSTSIDCSNAGPTARNIFQITEPSRTQREGEAPAELALLRLGRSGGGLCRSKKACIALRGGGGNDHDRKLSLIVKSFQDYSTPWIGRADA